MGIPSWFPVRKTSRARRFRSPFAAPLCQTCGTGRFPFRFSRLRIAALNYAWPVFRVRFGEKQEGEMQALAAFRGTGRLAASIFLESPSIPTPEILAEVPDNT
jgi:hypothetical protein